MSNAEDKPVEDNNRMWASASFVGLLIIIGLPLWWKTTEVYRVALPYSSIEAFKTQPLLVATELTILANDEQTANDLANAVGKAFEGSSTIKLKIHQSVLKSDLHHAMDTVADDQEAMEVVSENFDLTGYNHYYIVQRKQLYKDVWVGTERLVFFRDDKASSTVIQVLKDWILQESVLDDAKEDRSTEAPRRTRFTAAPSYQVLFSVVHPRPDLLEVDFDAGQVAEDYIGSFVDELEMLHNFTIKSQWLHLLEFDFQAKEIKDTTERGRHFAVRKDRLHLLLTKLEERLASRVSQSPTINLILYVQPCQKAPLRFYDERDNRIESPVEAFMSPKWGGVVIASPSAKDCEAKKFAPSPNIVMGALLTHLRQLLGIVEVSGLPSASLSPPPLTPRRWQLDVLMRTRTLEQLASARLALQSLAQLLGEISNIVINDEVGASINEAVEDIEIATTLLGRGELPLAYKTSLEAHVAAELAFTEPSLLALLYFPDDQKYAIYIPLFLPILFPVLLSLKNLLPWLRGKPTKEKTE